MRMVLLLNDLLRLPTWMLLASPFLTFSNSMARKLMASGSLTRERMGAKSLLLWSPPAPIFASGFLFGLDAVLMLPPSADPGPAADVAVLAPSVDVAPLVILPSSNFFSSLVQRS